MHNWYLKKYKLIKLILIYTNTSSTTFLSLKYIQVILLAFQIYFFILRQHRKKLNAVKQLKELIIHICMCLIALWFSSQGGEIILMVWVVVEALCLLNIDILWKIIHISPNNAQLKHATQPIFLCNTEIHLFQV